MNPVRKRCDKFAMGQIELTTRASRASRRTTMFRRLVLGLVAAASLGAVALAPSAASAKPWGWGPGWGGGWNHHHHWGPGFGVGYVGFNDGCYVTREVRTRHGWRLRTINICS